MTPHPFSPSAPVPVLAAFRRATTLVALFLVVANPMATFAAVGDDVTDISSASPTIKQHTPTSPASTPRASTGLTASAFDAPATSSSPTRTITACSATCSPMTTDTIADLVIGQPDFNSNVAEQRRRVGLEPLLPGGVAVDATGNLFVADHLNNRVLEYNRPFATDTVADRVIGQPDFTSNAPNNGGLSAASLDSPSGVAVDAAGNLWVADYGNNRVLEYNNPIATGDRIADLVLGQPDFIVQHRQQRRSSAPHRSSTQSASPSTRTGNVWVADALNNRVLEYDDPKTFGTTADRVLGQPSFTSGPVNYTGVINAAGLWLPYGVAVDINGNAYVATSSTTACCSTRRRSRLATAIADRVFGQPDFNSGTPNNGGISAQTLANPFSVADRPDRQRRRRRYWQQPHRDARDAHAARDVARGEGVADDGQGEVHRPRLRHGQRAARSSRSTASRLGTTKYEDLAGDGTARRVIASDALFDTLVPPGVPVTITVVNSATGNVSAPIAFTR